MDAAQTTTAKSEPRFKTADVCRRYAVNRNKVGKWIAAGHLEAVDVSETPGVGLPRWRFSLAALEEFDRRRSSRSKTTTTTPRPTSARAAVPDLLGIGD